MKNTTDSDNLSKEMQQYRAKLIHWWVGVILLPVIAIFPFVWHPHLSSYYVEPAILIGIFFVIVLFLKPKKPSSGEA